MFRVKLIGGVGKEVITEEHIIPAPDEEHARTWAKKQAKSVGMPGTVLVSVEGPI